MRTSIAFAAVAAAAAPALPSSYTAGFPAPVISYSAGGRAVCVGATLPVQATTNSNIKFNLPTPQNQTQVSQIVLDNVSADSPFGQSITGPPSTVSGTYNIDSQLCFPNPATNGGSTSKPTTVHFLTHGIGFAKAYWDFAPGYSYVDAAADAGYATFLYDRLGTGKSSRLDPIQEVQAPLEVEIAQTLIQALRKGAYGSTGFKKVVTIGHSYGSALAAATATKYPDSVDAVILTGFSTNQTGQAPFMTALNLAVASQDQPYRFSALNAGYMVASTVISNQIAFMHAPSFDPALLSLGDATKDTVTFGQFLSLRTLSLRAVNYTKPAAVVTGNEDLPFCNGNCSARIAGPAANMIDATLKALFPSVPQNKALSYIVPATGHGINLHYSAVSAYAQILKFLKSNGL